MVIKNKLNKTPYELWKGRKQNIGYFKVFGCKYFILNTKDNLGKFDAKSDEGIFLGYSQISKAYRVFNKWTLSVEESIHIVFDEGNPHKKIIDDEIDISKDASNNFEMMFLALYLLNFPRKKHHFLLNHLEWMKEVIFPWNGKLCPIIQLIKFVGILVKVLLLDHL